MRKTLSITAITDFFRASQARRRWDILVLVVLFGAWLFQSLGNLMLIAPDEGRYAEIPREMIELKDFLTPHLNYVKYFEKPPLYYWLTCISLKLFGENGFAVRFFSAVSALLGILLTYHVGRIAFGRRAGMLSAMVLGSSMGYYVQGRLNNTDMVLTLFMSATLGFFLVSQQDSRKRTRYVYLSSLCAALAVLTKGPIGIILPCAIIGIYALPRCRRGCLKKLRLARPALLFLLVSVPWFVLVSIRNPEFPGFFFIDMHLKRYASPDEHFQPIWFFIPVLLGFMFPWSLFFPAAVRRLWKGKTGPGADARSFLWIWLLVIICFFSLSKSKLVTYILPAFPAAALLIGQSLSDACDNAFNLIRRQAWAILFLLVVGAIGISLYPFVVANPRIVPHHCLATGAILFAGGLLGLVSIRSGDALKLFLALCATLYVLDIVAPPGALELLAEKKSIKKLALKVKELAPYKRVLVGSYGLYNQNLPFYAQRRIVVIGTRGELAFGSRQGNNSAWFIGYGQLSRIWDSKRPVLIVIRKRDMAVFSKSVKTPINVLGSEGKSLLISNRNENPKSQIPNPNINVQPHP